MFYVNYISINMDREIIALEATVHFDIITGILIPSSTFHSRLPSSSANTFVKWLMVGGGGGRGGEARGAGGEAGGHDPNPHM